MPKRPVTPYDFRLARIRLLLQAAKTFDDKLLTVDYGAHTIIKEIFISSYSNQFANIVKGEKSFMAGHDGAVYVDLFAGPGIVGVGKKADRVLGSPIASTLGTKFDFSVFVESRLKASKDLETRVSTYLPESKFRVKRGNCNEIVNEVLSEIKSRFKNPVLLVVVDPEGLQPRFEMLQRIAKDYPSSDFIINMTAWTNRVRSKIQAGYDSDRAIFEGFFGKERAAKLLESNVGVQMDEFFIEQLATDLGKPVGVKIPVVGADGKLVYNILAYTKARGDGQWGRVMKHLQTQLKGMDGSEAQTLLETATGRHGTLDSPSE